MNAKRNGTRNEHRSRNILDAASYAVCRAAVSLSPLALQGSPLLMVQKPLCLDNSCGIHAEDQDRTLRELF